MFDSAVMDSITEPGGPRVEIGERVSYIVDLDRVIGLEPQTGHDTILPDRLTARLCDRIHDS